VGGVGRGDPPPPPNPQPPKPQSPIPNPQSPIFKIILLRKKLLKIYNLFYYIIEMLFL